MGTRKFLSRVDWTKAAEMAERASKDPKLSPATRAAAAVSARHLRAFKPLRDKVMARNGYPDGMPSD
jgi:hypothetical protein